VIGFEPMTTPLKTDYFFLSIKLPNQNLKPIGGIKWGIANKPLFTTMIEP
jgi:hypothetical protein